MYGIIDALTRASASFSAVTQMEVVSVLVAPSEVLESYVSTSNNLQLGP